jgi:hypothetical protein
MSFPSFLAFGKHPFFQELLFTPSSYSGLDVLTFLTKVRHYKNVDLSDPSELDLLLSIEEIGCEFQEVCLLLTAENEANRGRHFQCQCCTCD